MITGSITSPSLPRHPLWDAALAWLRSVNHALPDGEHEIKGRDMYASVQSFSPLPWEAGIYESHRAYIDVHFCIEGGEKIEWLPEKQIAAGEAFDSEKDAVIFNSKKDGEVLSLLPGSYAVFFPGEAHMPKLFDGAHSRGKKAVIKIRASLLA